MPDAGDTTSRHHRQIRLGCFVLRCAVAAVLATWLSDLLTMRHTVWATMSALIVSQEHFAATRTQIAGRMAGTVTGALVALLALKAQLELFEVPLLLALAVAVAACAVVALWRPTWRVCLWTCPLVLLTAHSLEPPLVTALSRMSEVLLGVIVAGAVHAAEVLLFRVFGWREPALHPPAVQRLESD